MAKLKVALRWLFVKLKLWIEPSSTMYSIRLGLTTSQVMSTARPTRTIKASNVIAMPRSSVECLGLGSGFAIMKVEFLCPPTWDKSVV